MTATHATAAGTAERRRIWLCADDYGISNSVNIAIRDLVVRGRLNATSVMVVAPSFPRSEAIALNALNSDAPRVAIGLHLDADGAVSSAEQGLPPAARGRLPAAHGNGCVHAAMRRFEHDALVAEITLPDAELSRHLRPRARLRRRPSARASAPADRRRVAHRHQADRAGRLGATVRPRRSRSRRDSPTARGCSSMS